MALFIINFRQFVCFFPVYTGCGLALLVTKVSWAEVVTDVLCDVSSHIQTCSRAVPAKISLFIRVQEGGEIFTGQTGDTWWRANGTEMSNISTVPDYKYLTKISQNFLNILVETYTSSVCQSVKTSTEAGLCQPVWRSRISWIASVSSELNVVVLTELLLHIRIRQTDYPRLLGFFLP